MTNPIAIVQARLRAGLITPEEAGKLTTSKQLFASFADSVSVCANVNCVSKLPPGRSPPSRSPRAAATTSRSCTS